MNPETYWQSYVGDMSPGQFMYDYGSRDPEICVQRHMSRLPSLYGIVRQLSWADAFREDQHSREEVASALLAHLEDTRELWEQSVSQMPEQAWPRAAEPTATTPDHPERSDEDPEEEYYEPDDLPRETESEAEHVHPQRIDFPEELGHRDGCAHLSRDQGGLPREHTAKESPYILGRAPINTAVDQTLSIEQSIARSTPMYHAPEQELPLGTAVDQDLPLNKRPGWTEQDKQASEATPAAEEAPTESVSDEIAADDATPSVAAEASSETAPLEETPEPVETIDQHEDAMPTEEVSAEENPVAEESEISETDAAPEDQDKV